MNNKDQEKENGRDQSMGMKGDLKETKEKEATMPGGEAELGREETPEGTEGELEKETVPEGKEEEKEKGKIGRFFRRLLIWLVVVGVAFGAGIGTFYYLRYQPLQARVEQKSLEVQKAENEIANLEDEMERLSTFEERNQELEREIEQTRLHITILSARSSVADALLALSEDNLAEAKLELDKVDKTLDKLETMLNEDQVDVVKNMQQRHELIMEELEGDTFSARSDLEVLSSKLGSLENTLFATP